MPFRPLVSVLLLVALVSSAGCQLDRRADDESDAPTRAVSDNEATAFGRLERPPTESEIEQARRDSSWRGFVTRRTNPERRARPDTSASTSTPRPAERPVRADTAAYARALALPLSGDTDGDAVLYAQILLDRARFSPGQIDGRWGQNTEKAVYWLQHREGLDATGRLDRATLRRLVALADAPADPESLLVARTLTQDEVEGPFEEIPDDPYAQAEMDRLVYESLAEKLGEAYHAAPDLLRRLNPGRSLDALAAGDTLRVPALRSQQGTADVARLVVSDGGRYLHALDSAGEIVYHFPAVLGASYDPSPSETLEITSVVSYPGWHYQPKILENVDDSEEDAHIPPGPNNAVGVVWMGLSKPHYGIHGTAEPATIGHTVSAGCVRLTNWDVQALSRSVESGTAVEFRDVDGRSGGSAKDSTSADSTST